MIENIIIIIIIILILQIFRLGEKEEFTVISKDDDKINDKINDKIIIAGCAQNCSKYLPKILKTLDKLSKNKKVYYIFYENNSKDNTLNILENFVKYRNGLVISEKLNLKNFSRRTPRIAYCRNKIMKHIYDNNLHLTYKYYINLDLDDVNQYINADSVNKCLSESNKWDIASVNQKGYYYDLWALRTNFQNNNCWSKDECPKHTLSEWFPNIKELEKSNKIPRHLNYIPVLSAFGGFTIYKTYLLSKDGQHSWYSGYTNNDYSTDDCEHVNFHKSLLNKYPGTRFFIIPYMTTDK